MAQGVQHRVVLVGVDGLQAALRSALEQRGAVVAAVCADLTAARTEALAHPAESHLFVVHLPGDVDVSRLAALTSAAPGQPVVVLLPPGADLARFMAVQRAGAAQVVPLPFQADDFLRALDCIAVQFAPPAREARVIAVCGVSGGCGATTLALNLACELGLPGPRGRPGGVLLVELARQMGTLAAYLNINPEVSTHDLLSDASRLTTQGIRQALTTVAPGVDVLVGPYLDLTPGAFAPRHVYQLVALCKRLAATVVLDVPCSFDDLQFETLALADQVVLVGVQSIASVRTLKMVRDTLEREEGIRGQRLVINRYEHGLPGFSAAHLASLLQVPQVHTVANDYPSVMAAVNHGKPLRLAAPHSRVLADVRALADALAGSASGAQEGDRLARALGRGPAGPAAPRAVRVLHIEDDVVQQEVVAFHLAGIKELTCSITTARSESEAVRLFRERPFDVVLLDYHLAQGNGMGCLRQIREQDPIVPIVVVSGLAPPQVAAELLAAGADDFLSKENLSGERLARSLTDATARADACKQRLAAGDAEETPAEAARVDAFFDRVRKTIHVQDEKDLVHTLQELQDMSWPTRFSAGQIQRLVDLLCGELDCAGASKGDLPRRALLGLFLRLFGGEREGAGESGESG
jgi:pilus assembly protein CpaE